jgi:hypothetical protein
MITSTLIIFTACQKVDGVNPSQNKALNAISGKKEKKSGYMQNALNNWINNEWTPAVEKDETIKEQNKNESRSFTIQEYVDKASLYSKEKKIQKDSTPNESHFKKINNMPIIGKQYK